MHRELESLKELNGNTSPSSIQGSNHSHISESPGNSSTSGVSVASPTMLPSKLTKGSVLDITYNNGYGRGGSFCISFRVFSLTFISVDRPHSEDGRQENHDQYHRYHHHREDDVLTNSHHHHPTSMPPPPMPAFLDPTTISSTKSSINTNQHFDSPLITSIPPSISPLTSFANLSLLSPALIRSTSPSLVPFGHPPLNSAMTATTPTVPPRDKNAAAWSSLRRHTTELPSTSPLPSSHHNDIGCITSSSSSSPLTTIPANDADGQPIKYPSCTPSPPPSPPSPQPESLLMDTNDDIQSTPHSPDPTWRADSPSGDHVNPSIGLNVQMDEERYSESPVLDISGDHTDVVASSLRSPSRMPRDTTTSNGDEEEISTTDVPDYMNIDQSNHVTSPAQMEPAPLNDVPSYESPSTSFSLPQPVAKEEELRSDVSQEQHEPSCPPPPKVKMSLRDFALRKKKQREEEGMTKSVQDTSSSGDANLSFIKNEGGGLNGKQVERVEQADGELSNGKTVMDGIIGVEVKRMGLEEDLVDDLRDASYQGASSLSRPVVKDEVVDVPGNSIKPTTTNGYHPQPSSSPSSSSPQPSTAAFIYPSKQELIEQPIPTTIQPTIMDNTRYTAMYNNSRSISPINPDPHHFQSCSPPQEDGEIGEIMDAPLQLPSSPSSLRAAPPINRSASISGSIAPMPRGPVTKRADFAFTRPSSSQVRHSPPTHPRSYNASPPYRQQPPPVSTPPPAVRGTGVPPPTAPRALRQSMLSNRITPTTSTTMASTPSYLSPGSSTATASPASTSTTNGGRFTSYIPRGPSADRDRGWDMDQTQYARSLSRRDSREGHTWGGR